MDKAYYCPECKECHPGDPFVREEIQKKFPGKKEDFYDFFESAFNNVCPKCINIPADM